MYLCWSQPSSSWQIAERSKRLANGSGYGHSSVFDSLTDIHIRRQIPTIVANIVATILFGVLHQGGVVPAIFEVQRLMSVSGEVSTSGIAFWKTYMPPRHLLAIPNNCTSFACCGFQRADVAS